MGQHLPDIAVIVLLLLTIASAVTIISRRIRIPYTIALLIVGIFLSITNYGARFSSFFTSETLPELILFAFLPALLFEAAVHLDFGELKKRWSLVVLLAFVGILVSTFIAAAAIYLAGPKIGVTLPFTLALVFSAMIAPTDPVSVIALFKEMGISHGLSTVVEGESLFNDGTAVVLYRILVSIALIVTGASAGGSAHFNITYLIGYGVRSFVLVVTGGAVVGLVFGILAGLLLSTIQDAMVEITITVVLAYASFLTAEAFKISPVIAVVTAGLVISHYASRVEIFSSAGKVAADSFWEYLVFLVNSFIFLILGLSIKLGDLIGQWRLIILAVSATLLARALTVYVLGGGFGRWKDSLPLQWQHVLFWGGLRGSLSLAMALGLSAAFPHRSDLIVMASGVVFFTLLVQGLTIKPLLDILGLTHASPERETYMMLQGELLARQAAWRRLKQLYEDGVVSADVFSVLNARYQQIGQQLRNALQVFLKEHPELRREELLSVLQELLLVEKSRLQALRRDGVISDKVYERLSLSIDSELVALREESPEVIEKHLSPATENAE